MAMGTNMGPQRSFLGFSQARANQWPILWVLRETVRGTSTRVQRIFLLALACLPRVGIVANVACETAALTASRRDRRNLGFRESFAETGGPERVDFRFGRAC
jgi:hypothetical protein